MASKKEVRMPCVILARYIIPVRELRDNEIELLRDFLYEEKGGYSV